MPDMQPVIGVRERDTRAEEATSVALFHMKIARSAEAQLEVSGFFVVVRAMRTPKESISHCFQETLSASGDLVDSDGDGHENVHQLRCCMSPEEKICHNPGCTVPFRVWAFLGKPMNDPSTLIYLFISLCLTTFTRKVKPGIRAFSSLPNSVRSDFTDQASCQLGRLLSAFFPAQPEQSEGRFFFCA